jgi:hypothetical protein
LVVLVVVLVVVVLVVVVVVVVCTAYRVLPCLPTGAKSRLHLSCRGADNKHSSVALCHARHGILQIVSVTCSVIGWLQALQASRSHCA